MKKTVIAAALSVCAIIPPAAQATTPQQDLKAFRAYFHKHFPKVPFKEFSDGVYAIGPAELRAQHKDIMQFPPFDFELAKGKRLFHTPFKNGKTYASCFPHGGIGIRQNYPYFDTKTGQVVTLELAINQCRVKNGEKPYNLLQGPLAEISAYMASTSHGKLMDIKIPNDPRALAAYERGKHYFYAKRGQLNFSCADCHVYNAGKYVRSNLLSAGIGKVVSFPLYRAKWGSIGTLDKRFRGCNKQVRAKPLPAQSVEYRDLEYFLSYMSNGLPVNGPGYRM
ncbi:MAG: sulfur oxidation c-type cytochrome SoxA [Gammaproteobacteria bacterium]|nr:sulfur oxidation c-type cytochrome SoxA [Gammaproteobacteria bacterium]